MTDLIDTTEMYLKTVFELSELGVTPMRARIAERLGQSGPTVSQTVARMERDGLLFLDDDRVIHLSIEGEKIATAVMRKHRLAERHLIDVIGLEYAEAHEEACRWEHVMSLEVEKKIAALIAPPYVDPYGNPIPGLRELGIPVRERETLVTGTTGQGNGKSNTVRRLIDVVEADASRDLVIASIGEVLQSDTAFLRELAGHGIVAGASAHVRHEEGSFLLTVPGFDGLEISAADAGHVGVRAPSRA